MSITQARSHSPQPASAPPSGVLAHLGRWSYMNRRAVAVAWLLLLVLLTGLGHAAGSKFRNDLNGGHTESQREQTFLHHQFPGAAGDVAQVVFVTSGPVTSRIVQARVGAALASIARLPHVESVRSPFEPAGAGQVSPDQHVVYGVVQFDAQGDSLSNAAIDRVISVGHTFAGAGFSVQFGGTPIQRAEKPKFGRSEAIGLLAAAIILLIAFSSVIAMAIPLVIAIVALASTFGLLDLLSHRMAVPTFGPELAALIGLAVGIDYALFMVTRYRSALREGVSPEMAVVTSVSTAGRAVVFAGTTVVLSLIGLFLLGLPFIYGAAVGTIIAVALVLIASITLLPALLGFAGRNIDSLRVGRRHPAAQREDAAFWSRWSRQVQRRPWVTGAAATVILVLLALPFLSLRLAFTDAGTGPRSYLSRQAYDSLAKGFGPGANGPLVVALQLHGPAARQTSVAVEDAIARQPDIASVTPPRFNATGTAAVLTAIPDTSPQDRQTATLVRNLRDHVLPDATAGKGVRALVGGETAASIDTGDVISGHLATVLIFVIVLSVLLLTRAFRSVAVPLASAVMTLLSTGVAYGVVVAVFQWGWLGHGIDNGATAPVDPWVPVMLFTILFGLSMDYQVFLVSRIREERERGAPDSEAVARGLASTGRVITSAAAIMVCVFGAFVLGDLRVLRLFGLGMAVAILLDATLVRMVLMPSALQLLGRASWWLPGSRSRREEVELEPA